MRYKMSCLVILLFFSLQLCATIIYVHLGPSLPAYIYIALEQARLFNPEREICLIANQQAIKSTTYDFNAQKFTTIECETLTYSPEHIVFNKRTPHPAHVLDSFWRKAIERFFFLHEYIAQQNLKEVVHLESDNMLYVDISTIQETLSTYKGIGAVFDSDNRCIPSFVYIADKDAIAHLVQYIGAHASQPLFDMQFIAHYRNSSLPDKINHLPLIMPEYVEKYGLVSLLRERPSNPSLYVQNCKQFNSIFDAAAIGQHLGGIDPRHGSLKIGFINETCVFNPSHLLFQWVRDEKARRVPYAIFDGKLYRINNLHIHSKQLEKFRS